MSRARQVASLRLVLASFVAALGLTVPPAVATGTTGSPAQIVTQDPLLAPPPAGIRVVDIPDGRTGAEKVTPGLRRRMQEGGSVKVLILLKRRHTSPRTLRPWRPMARTTSR